MTSVDIPTLASAEFARGNWLNVCVVFCSPNILHWRVLPPGAQYWRNAKDEAVSVQGSERQGDSVWWLLRCTSYYGIPVFKARLERRLEVREGWLFTWSNWQVLFSGGIPMDKFGWFYGRNGSTWSDGVLTMDTGTDNIEKLGDIRQVTMQWVTKLFSFIISHFSWFSCEKDIACQI